jgi:hypothetical protein
LVTHDLPPNWLDYLNEADFVNPESVVPMADIGPQYADRLLRRHCIA